MELKFEYHDTRLDVWINGKLAIQGLDLIGYVITGNRDSVLQVKIPKISVTRDPSGFTYEIIGSEVQINLKTKESSVVTYTNTSMTTVYGDKEVLVF